MILSTWKWAVLTRKFVEFSGFSPPLHMILCIAQVNVQFAECNTLRRDRMSGETRRSMGHRTEFRIAKPGTRPKGGSPEDNCELRILKIANPRLADSPRPRLVLPCLVLSV
jgi:hypothetical protein